MPHDGPGQEPIERRHEIGRLTAALAKRVDFRSGRLYASRADKHINVRFTIVKSDTHLFFNPNLFV